MDPIALSCPAVSRPRDSPDRRSPEYKGDLRSGRWLGQETGHNRGNGNVEASARFYMGQTESTSIPVLAQIL